jgi:CRP/FNR family cyclic AMP-dependent transcriptional regulator
MPEIDHFKNAKDVIHFKAGDTIFNEGDPAEVMYALQAGEVEIVQGARSLAFLGAGSIFGEMALIDHAPRNATAIALTDCTLVPVDRHRFQFLVHETPTFATRVMQTLSHRLREIEGHEGKASE